MAPKFKFLFAPLEGVGHIQASVGIGQQLLSRGHTVVFATPNSWRGKLQLLGFDEEYFQEEEDGNSLENWGKLVESMAPALALPVFEKMQTVHLALFEIAVKKAKDSHEALKKLVKKVKPDVIFVDNSVQIPSLMNSGIPWILSISFSPLYIMEFEDFLPPALSGYPIFNNDKTAWIKHADKTCEVYHDLFQNYKSWVVDNGGPVIKTQPTTCWSEFSPYANIHMFPEEMSYDMHLPDTYTTHRQKWYRFDAFVREEKGKFELPAKLQNLPGKLIYFSLGTIGCSELGLMRRLIEILSKSPHRFIVSKGPLGDQLELSDNMWGANNLSQTLILPLVDLVITHGGNNTVTESFYFGKPLLVMPLFVDQLDNAARVHETGHGLRFEPYRVTEDELLTGIDTLLNDELLKRRMRSIGVRIRASNPQSRAADVVENVARINST